MKSPNHKSLSISIAFRFVLVVFLSNLAFITAIFFLLRIQLAKKDQNIAAVRFHEIGQVIEINGIAGLRQEAEQGKFNQLEDLLIVVHDSAGSTLFERMPRRLANFNVAEIQNHVVNTQMKDGVSTIYPDEWFEETIEIFAGKAGGYRLTVGVNTDASEDFLHLFFQMALALSLVSTAVSVVLGYVTTKKSLQPIRELIATVKSVRAGDWALIDKSPNTEDELSELTNLFNEMIVQIQRLVSSLQTSLDSIAHDLRTPLTHISNRVESFIKEEDPQISRDAAGALMEEVQAISGLLNTLLEITEADSQSSLLHKDWFAMDELLAECVELYEYIAEEKQAMVTTVCDKPVNVYGDRNKIKRVVANLLDNALKYSLVAPQIKVECHKLDRHIVLSVEDDGIGVPDEDVSKIWQRLYRGDSSRTTPGMGLGLSFVKSIVDAHGWTVHVEQSSFAQGAKFKIVIPSDTLN